MMIRRSKAALFIGLAAAGLIGVLLGAPFSIAVLSDAAAGGPIDPATVWGRALLEALLLLLPAAAVGLWLGSRVGLGAVYPAMLAADTAVDAHPIRHIVTPALLVGVAIASPGLLGWMFIPQAGFGPGLDNPTLVDWLLRSISAALTEEIAFRFGLMTLLVWLTRAVVAEASSERVFWVGNTGAALVFAGAHLPPILSLDAMLAHATADIVQHVIPRSLIAAFGS
jgi:hypothetical protein